MKYVDKITCSIMMFVMCFLFSVEAAEQEKLLFGFERDEVEKAAVSNGLKVKENALKELDDGGVAFFQNDHKFFHEREMDAIRPMRCVPGKASQGKFACRIAETARKNLISYPSFRLPRIGALPLHLGEPQANIRIPELFNTSGWFASVFPEDWSGYDLLRIDVLIETPEQITKIMMEVEDDLVEPPVSLTYVVPPKGKWVTLEMDLSQAVIDRYLNIKKINNIFVRINLKNAEKNAREMYELRKNEAELSKRRFLAWVDNVRIAKKGTPCNLPLLKGVRSIYTKKLPRSYAVEENHSPTNPITRYTWPDLYPVDVTMPETPKMMAKPVSIKLEAPEVIPIQKMIMNMCDSKSSKNERIHDTIRLMSVAAVDDQKILVAFYIMNARNLKVRSKDKNATKTNWFAAGVRTADGGKSWTNLDGTEKRASIFGGNTSKVTFRMTDIGGDVGGFTYFGCSAIVGAHVAYPADRVFFTRSVFTGDSWWKSPKYMLSGDPRHCHDVEWGDVVRLGSGRLWAAWNGKDRQWYESGPVCSYAYYSDDRGASWNAWRKPGLSGSLPSLKGTYLRVAPYREGVALFGSSTWTYFDGKTWSSYEKTGLGGKKGCSDAVSFGEEIYLGHEKGPRCWYDGKAWHDFTVPGRTGNRGKIGVCGGETLVFVETDESQKKLLCWRKKKGGTWQGPEVLVEEKTKINKIASQRYAPAGFLPVAYTCDNADTSIRAHKSVMFHFAAYYPWERIALEPWIKVVKVPAEG